MKNKNNMENKFFKHLFENKRLVLTLEVVLLVMSLFVMIVGRIYQWDSVLIAIMDGIFTAMLLAVITTIINWNVQSNYEEIISQLKEDNNLLSQTTEQFKTMETLPKSECNVKWKPTGHKKSTKNDQKQQNHPLHT